MNKGSRIGDFTVEQMSLTGLIHAAFVAEGHGHTMLIDLISRLEAVLFACGEPISAERLSQVCAIEKEHTLTVLEELQQRYESDNSGLTLLKLGDSYQIATKPEFAAYIKAAIETKKTPPLSPAAMEVLAIIAYNQPISRAFIEQVRGIDSSSVVNTLVERQLVEEAGRLDLPGRPIAYRTSRNFLRCFGLKKLGELPPLPESGGAEQLTLLEESNESDTSLEEPEANESNDLEGEVWSG